MFGELLGQNFIHVRRRLIVYCAFRFNCTHIRAMATICPPNSVTAELTLHTR